VKITSVLFSALVCATPVSAQFAGFCQSGQRCDFFSELGYAYRVGGTGSGFDHSIVFENGILSETSRNTAVGASGYWGIDFRGHMRTGLKFRLRRVFGSTRLDAGLGAILLDSRGFSPSFVADLAFSPVKPVSLVGSLEIIRGVGKDVAVWSVGARVWREDSEPDSIGSILLAAGAFAAIIRSII
jgi:hypothetical protein